MNENSKKSEISNFYSGKNILITGATGFMGKVLVEKLLRDCDELSKIFVLIRPKKNVDIRKRREEMINSMIFDVIRDRNSEKFEKIKVIEGDLTLDNFGLNGNDETELVENIHIIFHCAANVRFDQTLKCAVNFNLNGTHRVLKLAEKMKHLIVFTHISTAYCHCNETVLEERYYPSNENPYGVIEMVKMMKDETLEMITPKLLNGLPNTYAYTKGLTEDLVHSYREKFPIVIARPSIVTAAWKTPFPGWIEGLNGPTGLLIGAGKGVIRSMHGNPNHNSEAVPVDITINAIIILAYKRSGMSKDICYFCNLTESGANPLTWGDTINIGRKLFYDYPMCQSLWYPNGSIKPNYYKHMFCVIFFHYLPAYFIDFLMIIFRQKPFLVKVQKRVSQGLKVLQYYTTREWIFINENFLKLHRELNDVDKKKFSCDLFQIDITEYLLNFIKGTRYYLLKESPESLPKARATLKRLYYLDKFVSMLFYALIFYLLWINIDWIMSFLKRLIYL
ncbi:CLUMA_CG015216, isoform A [Clunio marinus]|uniref:Fatty acyl-CoA reductase n=1 Tax=Clunio marinus TaxID=568069 RepID=A0A1J1INY6_9DIPT|nr:CLUMA_CG015216, isoform A [Clunio marinus]